MTHKAVRNTESGAPLLAALLGGAAISALVANSVAPTFPLNTWIIALGIFTFNLLATRGLNRFALGKPNNAFLAISLLGGGLRTGLMVIFLILAAGLRLAAPFELILITLSAYAVGIFFEVYTLHTHTERSA